MARIHVQDVRLLASTYMKCILNVAIGNFSFNIFVNVRRSRRWKIS